MRLVIASALALGLVTGAAHAGVKESFEGFQPGDSLNGATVLGGLATLNSNRALTVFDTANPTGGDDDLGQDPTSGNALILQEGQGEPDDRARGGKYQFTFDAPVDLLSVLIRDIEENSGIRFYNGAANKNNLILQTDCGGDGCVEAISFAGLAKAQDLSVLTVKLAGSGAIDDIHVTPLPGAALLLGSGLAALGYARRRRAQA